MTPFSPEFSSGLLLNKNKQQKAGYPRKRHTHAHARRSVVICGSKLNQTAGGVTLGLTTIAIWVGRSERKPCEPLASVRVCKLPVKMAASSTGFAHLFGQPKTGLPSDPLLKVWRISTKPKSGNPQAGLRSMWQKSPRFTQRAPRGSEEDLPVHRLVRCHNSSSVQIDYPKIEDIFGGDPSYQKRSHSLLELIRQQKSKLLFYHSNGHRNIRTKGREFKGCQLKRRSLRKNFDWNLDPEQ